MTTNNIFTLEEMNIILNKNVSSNIINDIQSDIIIIDDNINDVQGDTIIIDEQEKLRIKKEKLKENQRKYYELNKELILEKNRQYYKNNKENIIDKKKQYYDINKETINLYKKGYYNINKEAIINNQKEYYNKNKETIIQNQMKYYYSDPTKFYNKHHEYYMNKIKLDNDKMTKINNYAKQYRKNALINNPDYIKRQLESNRNYKRRIALNKKLNLIVHPVICDTNNISITC
jgi:hypothetical protein